MIDLDKLFMLLELAKTLTNYDNKKLNYESRGELYTEEATPDRFYKYLTSIIPLIPREDDEPIQLYKHDISLVAEFNIVNGGVPIYAYCNDYFLCTAQTINTFECIPILLLECVYEIDRLQKEEGFTGITSESVTGHSISRAVNTQTGIPSYLNDILNRYKRPILGDLNALPRCL